VVEAVRERRRLRYPVDGSLSLRLGIMVALRPGRLLSEQRTYRQFTPQQKAEVVLAGLRGNRSVRDMCRES